ncbi:hypothetical protein M514_06932 [Trichuris suis]|uniref:Uncharacterized protein n=1 Tax=Trichuris suis TaxID=68888 RepID=A0A085NLI7_9BILA|nr:hypothetical protein M513_06932 [Trichuris suis]KFD70333.1 hypothetical protein M514_06932 [Trichuris suis]
MLLCISFATTALLVVNNFSFWRAQQWPIIDYSSFFFLHSVITINRLLYCWRSGSLVSSGLSHSRKLPMSCWLKSRRLLRLAGPDCLSLLQGLLTNDVTKLNDEKCSALYSLMLNVRGRILYELFLYRQGQHPTDILVECDSSVSDSLCSLLRRHVLHKKVDVQLESTKQVYWLQGADKVVPTCNMGDIFVPDPRLACLGARWLSEQKPNDDNEEKRLLEAYANLRYSQALPEGAIELPPDTSFPHEMSADLLGAVSFSKGCYLGQELTSRVEHIGVVRKRLMPLCFDPVDLPLMRLVQFNSNIYDSTTQKSVIGRFKAAGSQYAIGLLNVTEALRLGTVLLAANDTERTRMIRCKVMRPQWWPASIS